MTTSNTMTTNPLAAKAVLVDLKTKQLQTSKLDKALSDFVASSYGTKGEAGRFSKTLIDKKEGSILKQITRAMNDFRTLHYSMTLPWASDGMRILPTNMIQRWDEQFDHAKAKVANLVAQLVKEYPAILQEQENRLGTLYDATQYPEADALETHFIFERHFWPISESGDFRVSVSAEALAAMKADMEAQNAKVLHGVAHNALTRLHESISKMAERLSHEKNVFRDTLVSNLSNIVELCSDLPINDDPEIEDLIRRARERLAPLLPDDLRGDKIIRATAHVEASDIKAKLEAKMAAMTGDNPHTPTS